MRNVIGFSDFFKHGNPFYWQNLQPFSSNPPPPSILDLFKNGEQGLWYDPNDLTAEKINWRRNLLTYSEQFSNPVWVKTASIVSQDVAIAPDGTLSAEKLIESSTSEPHVLRGSSMTLSGIYTGSMFIKAGERTKVSFGMGPGLARSMTLDLLTGEFTNTAETWGFYGGATYAGDGWYRAWITNTTPFPSSGITVTVATRNADGVETYLGDGVSGVYVWGAQLELGSTVTSYQKITDFNTEFMTAFPNHALFQDSAGTTPVAAAGQPVGLMLDKRLGLVRGANIPVTSNNAAVTYTGGVATFTAAATGSGVSTNPVALILGRTYEVTFRVVSISAGSVRPYAGSGGGGVTVNAPGTYTQRMQCAGNTIGSIISLSASTTAVVDSIMYRELPGNHAIQATAASRPIWSARKNLLTMTDVLATQSLSVTSAPKVLSFYGTGSIVLSGAATGTLQGTGVNNRVWVDVTPTAGTLTLTVSGDVRMAQLEDVV